MAKRKNHKVSIRAILPTPKNLLHAIPAVMEGRAKPEDHQVVLGALILLNLVIILYLWAVISPYLPAAIDEITVQAAWDRFWEMGTEDVDGLSILALVERHALTPELAERIQEEGFPLRQGVDYDDMILTPGFSLDSCEGLSSCSITAYLTKDNRPTYTATLVMRRYVGIGWRFDSCVVREEEYR